MAYVTRTRTRTRRQPYRRRRYGRRQASRWKGSSQPSQQIGPLATKLKGKLNYYDALSLNAGAGTIAQHVFSLNGLYDCNISGVGHQPSGWDQIMVLYDHACAIHTDVTVNFSNTDASYHLVAVAYVADSPTSAATII